MKENHLKKNNVVVWGSGTPLREFVHVKDLVRALAFVMQYIDAEDVYCYNISHINVGSGEEVSIKELAFMIKEIVGYQGNITFDNSMPDGTPRKILDTSFLNQLNWTPKIKLEEGIYSLYQWFKKNQGQKKALY